MFFAALFTVQAQDFIIEDGETVDTCEGTFYDTGGATGNYSANENITYTICSDDPNGVLTVDFTSWQVEGGWDDFLIYDGDNTSAPLIYSYTAAGNPAPGFIQVSAANTSGCLTFNFTSDGSVQQNGWAASISCPCMLLELSSTVATDDATLDGSVTATADLGVEPYTFEWTDEDGNVVGTTATVDGIGIGTYTATVTDSEGCEEIESIDVTGPIFFVDDPDVDICAGVFYDTGGPDSGYSTNEDEIITFCSDTPGELMTLNFTSWDVDGGWDSFFIYDGDATSDPVLYSFTNAGTPAPGYIEATGECLTVEFNSAFIGGGDGWEATIACVCMSVGGTTTFASTEFSSDGTATAVISEGVAPYTYEWTDEDGNVVGTEETATGLGIGTYTVTATDAEGCVADGSVEITIPEIFQEDGTFTTCSGFYYDSGGPDGNYSANENSTVTICSDDPNGVLTLDYTAWQVEGGWDDYFIYDGDDATAPLLYSYTAGGDPAPGLIQVTPANASGCLTITFTSDGSVQQSGWIAEISCPCMSLDLTSTFASDDVATDGSVTVVVGGGVDPYTYEWVDEDGNVVGTTATVEGLGIGTYIVTVTDAEGCDEIDSVDVTGPIYYVTDEDFEACSGVFYDSGGPDGNYPVGENETITICPDGPPGTLTTLDFTSWSVDGAWDSFFIYDGDDATAPTLYSYTSGADPAPGLIEATEGCLTIQFNSAFIGSAAGWEATIGCQYCQEIDLNIGSSLEVVSDTATVCLGIDLTADLNFPENGLVYDQSPETSTYLWTVEGDENSPYTTQDISLEFTEQGVFEVTLLVTDANDCNSDLVTMWINNPSPASYLELNIAEEDDTVCIGESVPISMMLTYDTWIIPPSVLEVDPVFLDDVGSGGSAIYTSDLTLTSFFEPDAVLENIDCITIWIDMEHSFGGDLTMNLYAPNGEQILLLEDQNGGGVGNGLGGFFIGEPVDPDEAAPTPGIGYTYAFTATGSTIHDVITAGGGGGTLPESDISAGTDIYGFYNEDYEDILGTPLNGTWTLEIIDTWGADNGYVFSWGIDFCDDYPSSGGTIEPTYTDSVWSVTFNGLPTDNSTITSYEEFGIIATPDEGGDYIYTLTVTDNFGCDWVDEVEVYAWDVPEAGPDVTLICDPDYELQGELDTEEGGYWTYLGPPGGIVTFFPSNEVLTPDVIFSDLGEYIMVLHDNTCNYTDTTIVTVETAAPIINYEEQVFCNFDMPISIANVVQTGVWTGESIDGTNTVTFADPTASATTVSVSNYGEYYFTYTFDFCNTSTTVHVEFLQEDPVVAALPDTIFCDKNVLLSAAVLGQEDHWEATGPGIVTFQDFEALTTEASVSEYGTYEFIYYGCGASDMVEVTFAKSAPVITAPSFVECGFDAYVGFSYIGTPGSLSVTGPGNATYDGLDPVGTTLTVDEYGEYFLTYEGCDSTVTHMVTFMCALTVPNVFSPNNDGVNDSFIIERLDPEYYNKSYFTIYNRWGNVVYTNGNYGLNGVWWDGKNSLNGERLPDGVYYYTLELYNHVRGVEENYSGNISVFTDK